MERSWKCQVISAIFIMTSGILIFIYMYIQICVCILMYVYMRIRKSIKEHNTIIKLLISRKTNLQDYKTRTNIDTIPGER